MKYRLIAIDLDGTLLLPGGSDVSDANRAALADAMDAGALVIPCTGRAWHEAHLATRTLEGLGVGVFVTGAILNDVASGASLHASCLEPDIITDLVDTLSDLPESVLLFHDRHACGHDYVVAGRGELPDNTRWWFEHSQAIVRYDARPRDLRGCVRVGMVSHNGHLAQTLARIEDRFAGRINAHRFGGIVREDEPNPVEILEVFPAGVDKWTGIQRIAREHGIADAQVAVIGDEINDVPMLRAAGCSVAMANAKPPARAAAQHVTRSNAEDGVAHAIRQMLEGAW